MDWSDDYGVFVTSSPSIADCLPLSGDEIRRSVID